MTVSTSTPRVRALTLNLPKIVLTNSQSQYIAHMRATLRPLLTLKPLLAKFHRRGNVGHLLSENEFKSKKQVNSSMRIKSKKQVMVEVVITKYSSV